MASFLSRLNPVPSFPSYTGPYQVGTFKVEIPTSELPSSSPAPDPEISSVSFRIFYPCEPPTKASKPVYWIPQPQHDYVRAYARFLGASSRLSDFIAYLPRLIYYTTIPAIRNARLLRPPTKSKRWPVMVFSHGLGGSRNAYSHLLGSLSSHGMVVIAPDHRDGSAPMSVINGYHGSKGKVVEYNSISHAPSREVEDARDEQLRIRLWELGLVYEALLKIDDGGRLSNIAVNDAPPTNNASIDELSWFASSLDVHTPGAISWSGHSFGGATIVQFVKSVYYRPSKSTPTYRPLYAPSDTSRIVQQITPHSPISLLDLWTLPLRSGSMQWLWNKPLPSYTNGGPGGSNIIAILSEAFFKWRGNLVQTKRAISEDPSMEHPSVSKGRTSPYIFYPISSAHLSQSDFGVLFPYLTKKAFKAEEPERTLRLNVRALLEVLRLNGVQVADTSDIDMENAHQHPVTITMNGHSKDESSHVGKDQSILSQDHKILATDGSVRGWVALSISEESRNGEATNVKTQLRADPSEAVMDGEVLTAGGQDQKLRQI